MAFAPIRHSAGSSSPSTGIHAVGLQVAPQGKDHLVGGRVAGCRAQPCHGGATAAEHVLEDLYRFSWLSVLGCETARRRRRGRVDLDGLAKTASAKVRPVVDVISTVLPMRSTAVTTPPGVQGQLDSL